jgi:hypothetical protein
MTRNRSRPRRPYSGDRCRDNAFHERRCDPARSDSRDGVTAVSGRIRRFPEFVSRELISSPLAHINAPHVRESARSCQPPSIAHHERILLLTCRVRAQGGFDRQLTDRLGSRRTRQWRTLVRARTGRKRMRVAPCPIVGCATKSSGGVADQRRVEVRSGRSIRSYLPRSHRSGRSAELQPAGKHRWESAAT